MAQLGEGLVERGHRVSVLTAFPHYERFRVWDEYRGKLVERDCYRGMDVTRVYVYAAGNKQRMLRRLLSYMSFNALAAAFGALSRERYDLIVCSNGSFFSGLAAALIGAVKGSPFIYNVQDLYPETPVQAGQLRNRFAIGILEWLEKVMYARAEHVTVISPSFRDNIAAKGVPSDKITTIPNFVDTDFIRPLAKDNAFSRRNGLVDRFVVTHAGNVGYVYDLETLVEAAALLRSRQDMQFLIVGDGVVRPHLEAKVSALRLTNVRFLPYQAHASLPEMRAASDVQLALYKGGSSRFSMPSKIYEIMASGRPVLASADSGSDLRGLIADVGFGICVDPHRPKQLADALLALYEDPNLRMRMGQRGRDEAERVYSVEAIVNRYDDLIESLGSRPPVEEPLLQETRL
jgi:colanic acid biosynthesis glycosyl transferase WcaI